MATSSAGTSTYNLPLRRLSVSKGNSDKSGEVAGEVVEMSKQSIKISMELFLDGRIELHGPYNSPVMFLGALEVGKQIVHKECFGDKTPKNIVIPVLKGPPRTM